MKSTLKAFLVLNLLLCIGATVMGYLVFMDREVVKARTVILEEHVGKLADSLEYGTQKDWEDSAIGQGTYALPLPVKETDLPGYIAQLDALEGLATSRVEQLGAEYDTLIATRKDLADTRAVLAEREADLSSTRTRVATLKDTLDTTRGNLRDAQSELATLQRTNQTLQRQVEDLDAQIDTNNQAISATREKLELRTGERDRIETLLAAFRRPVKSDGSVSDWHQKTARVLEVDPEWNYVVVNKGEVDVLPMFLEAFVHRGDEFIGKIRIMQVEDTVALAEVLPETMTPGTQVEAGDTIFF